MSAIAQQQIKILKTQVDNLEGMLARQQAMLDFYKDMYTSMSEGYNQLSGEQTEQLGQILDLTQQLEAAESRANGLPAVVAGQCVCSRAVVEERAVEPASPQAGAGLSPALSLASDPVHEGGSALKND